MSAGSAACLLGLRKAKPRPRRRSAGLGRINGMDSGKILGRAFLPKGHLMATKERLAAMAASLCALCSGEMVATLVVPDPNNGSWELRTYECAQCGHCRTYSVEGLGD